MEKFFAACFMGLIASAVMTTIFIIGGCFVTWSNVTESPVFMLFMRMLAFVVFLIVFLTIIFGD